MLHKWAIEKYLEGHEAKAFHDPLAAILHLHPELGVWLPAKPIRIKNGWAVEPVNANHASLIDLVTTPWSAYFNGLCGK
jgi:hypothetical protein